MKLYNAPAPNPRLVRMFLVEKRIKLDTVEISIAKGENRQGGYLEQNPGGQLPALELDDGTLLAETVVICEYVEEKHPNPPLIGSTPEERAETRMWLRRIELNITEPMYAGFRYAEGHDFFKDRMPVLPEAANGLKQLVQKKLEWLDGLMNGKPHLVGERFTLADIALYAALDFGAGVGQTINPKLKNMAAWFERVSARPSATESLHAVRAMRGG